MSMREKKNNSSQPKFVIFKEQLRSRQKKIQLSCLQKHCCTGSKSVLTGNSTIASPINTPSNHSSMWIKSHKQRINWLKYNILVGIYENWIRIYPLIKHLLNNNTLGFTVSDQIKKNESIQSILVQKNSQQKNILTQNMKQQQIESVYIFLKKRRNQLLAELQVNESGPNDQDMNIIKMTNKLAKQLLSTLPIQNSKWTKNRIQNHNKLIEDMINNFSQDQFAKNSQVILHSIKERIVFIHQMQEKYIKINNQQKNNLGQKILLLKRPFGNVLDNFDKNKSSQVLLQQLWTNISNQREKKLNARPQLRKTKKKIKNQRFTVIQHPQTGKLTVKYQLKKSDYFNQNYIRDKNSKGKVKKNKVKLQVNSQGLYSEYDEQDLDKVNENIQQQASISSIKSIKQPQKDFNDNLQYAEAFMRRQRTKPMGVRDQKTSTYFKQLNTKFDTSKRSSHIFGDITKNTRDSIHRTSITSIFSHSGQKRDSFGRRGSGKRQLSIEDIQEEKRQQHYSRFKSHKKIGTMKHIGTSNWRTRVTKESNSKLDRPRDSIRKLGSREGKSQKKQIKREGYDMRKGNLIKRGGQRKQFQIETTTEDQPIIDTSEDYMGKRQDFINYFSKIKAKGLLQSSDKHQQIKNRIQLLLKKYSPTSVLQTHQYALKMIQMSLPSDEIKLLEQSNNRSYILQDLREVISNDQRVRMKIKQQMKIFFQQGFGDCVSEKSLNNEQFMFNSTEIRHLNQQLKRILRFRTQNEQLNVAKRLINCSTVLEQRQFV